MVSYHCIIIIIVAFSSVLTGSVHVRNCDISDNISRLGPAQLATALAGAGWWSQCGECSGAEPVWPVSHLWPHCHDCHITQHTHPISSLLDSSK